MRIWDTRNAEIGRDITEGLKWEWLARKQEPVPLMTKMVISIPPPTIVSGENLLDLLVLGMARKGEKWKREEQITKQITNQNTMKRLQFLLLTCNIREGQPSVPNQVPQRRQAQV